MSKEGSKIQKVCTKKKINRYSKEDCQKELVRLTENKSDNSKYAEDLKKRLAAIG